ncbi:SLC13 family permease [Paenibacillus qinlingensis]|uniref:SLC13 family permease n=1 Tax=Paenibacillus qinlingensis TaxID=1837343 RepID=UPI001566D72B|nr:SLC13 family permease [Paenibacillus qinlingensis]NQX63426.1 anion permease [Paenibacillus qinlingensis]
MAIKDMEMFKDFSNIELAKLLGKLDMVKGQAGDMLFEQGDPGDSMYLIESGRIELFSQKQDGTRQSLASLQDGDTLGEMALLTNEPRSATAIIAIESVLYYIDRETFDRLVVEQPQISSYFIRLLSQRLVSTNGRLQASKEAKAQWVLHEVELLPTHLRDFLLACACLPSVRDGLLKHLFGMTIEDANQAYAALGRFVQEDVERDSVHMRPEIARVLLDILPQRYGERQQQLWVDQALAYYRTEGDWASVVEVYAARNEWELALEVAAIAAGELVEKAEMAAKAALDESERQQRSIGQALRRCPDELLVARYAVLWAYVRYCVEHAPEAGLSIVEAALDQRGAAYSAQQLATVYEWGADLCRKLGRKQLALEYLQLAESTALSSSGSTKRSGDQSFGLAKQMLARSKSERLAAGAGRLSDRSRWLGLAAVILAVASVLGFHVAEPVAGLSRHGMDFIGIGLAAVILWIVNIMPDYIVALGMAMLWVLGGLVEPEIALSGFASPTWLYMIFIMAMSAVITKSGFLYRFSLHALKRFPANYRGQLWGIVAGGIMLNPMIPSSSAKVSLGVPIAQTLSESMGFGARSHGAAGLGLTAMLFYGFTAPFVLTGSYTNVLAFGLVTSASPVNWIQWFLYALPAFIIFSSVLLTIIFIMFRKTASAKPIAADVLDEQLRLLGPLTREERIAVVTVLSCIIMLVLQPLHGIDSAWIMLIGFAVLVISGVLDRKTISTGIDWTFLLFLGVAFSFSAAANELGLVEALSSFLGQHMGIFVTSPFFFLAAVIVLSFIVTLIVRDDPAVILLVTALLPLANQAGVHPWILVFVVLLSTDPFFFAYQSPTYLTAYYSSEGKAFSHRQGQKVAFAYGLAVLLLALLCVPYWKWLGLIH